MQQRKLQVRFDCREGPRRLTIPRFVKTFEHTVSVIDNKKAVSGRKKSVRTVENIAYVQQVLTRSQIKFIKRLSQQLGLKQKSTPTIVRQGLNLFLYKIQMQQSPDDVDTGESPSVVHLFNTWKKIQQ
jgi:hypothetical protein